MKQTKSLLPSSPRQCRCYSLSDTSTPTTSTALSVSVCLPLSLSLTHTHLHIHTQIHTQRDRQTDRQTDTHTHTHTHNTRTQMELSTFCIKLISMSCRRVRPRSGQPDAISWGVPAGCPVHRTLRYAESARRTGANEASYTSMPFSLSATS